MATIQEAMSNSAKLLADASKGVVAPDALTAEVTKLLASSLSARGFMAALATGDLPGDAKVRAALIEGIRAGKDSAYELVIKNIIMSGCSAQEHEQNGRAEAARGSRATSSCSLELARLLHDSSLAAMAQEALLAIAQWPKQQAANADRKEPNLALANWYTFFERWGYSQKQLEAVSESLASIAEAG
jgi:hypothetical protein